MKHSEPLILNKEEFFEGFDNPSLQEKVVGVKIALLQNDNGEIGLGLGIEAPPLHSREIEEINRFFAKKYNVDEMIQKLLQHYQDQRSQNADSKSQSDRNAVRSLRSGGNGTQEWLQGGDLPQIRRDGGYHHSRYSGGTECRTDQDRSILPQRSCGEVQPAACH